eukprot:TRINITY_DN46224_c0_g1_i1.p1 TRINITY_DN46224_c0_g1~~TRINITY_DN46224_c0_g1_i1.p1  ORF type:complete len:156 (-),score=24.14 TRINITY_DN46224_c0_g1_i1:302-769(-)
MCIRDSFASSRTFVTFDTGCPKGVEVNAFSLGSHHAAESPKEFKLIGSDSQAKTFHQPEPWEGNRTFYPNAVLRGRYWTIEIVSSHNGRGPTLTGFTLSACPGNTCRCLWDQDNDGVLDLDDLCPDSKWGRPVEWTGCDYSDSSRDALGPSFRDL